MGERRYVFNVPVSSSYEGFVREVQRHVARRVASRTIGPDGQPVRREVTLTEGNASLRNTYSGLLARGMERAEIRATFHTNAGGRVERITFAPPRVVPIAPTTITASPPRPSSTPAPGPPPSPPPTPRRPGRGPESEGEVAGVPGALSGGRYFYGVHTTRHDTMCYGRYDNQNDVCQGVETENSMVHRLHYDQGQRDLMYLMRHLGTDVVATDGYQSRLRAYTRRMNNGRPRSAPLADRVYRQGALEGYRRARIANPNLPDIL